MIGQLKGTVVDVGDETCIMDVQGVGYEVHAMARVLGNLAPGEAVTLSIETIVREDLIRLYGFGSSLERRAFRLLQSVQGVGAKHALAILQILPPAALYDALATQDVSALSRAHGVGKKIAQRISVELQSKLGTLAGPVMSASGAAPALSTTAPAPSAPTEAPTATTPIGLAVGAKADAISALGNLGYEQEDARRAVAHAASGEAQSVEELIRDALKALAPA